jgi:signal peptide peptidase SppA
MSKRLYRIENALYNNVWCIRPDVYFSMIKQLQAHYKGEVRADSFDDIGDGETINLNVPPNVALICVDGTIGKHLSMMETACGGVDVDSVSQQLIEANENTNIDSILLYVNSPGGTIVGIPELAQLITSIAANKDVIGYVDVMACSAGYWVISQCTAVYAAPSAIIGNIGAYNVLVSEVEALKKAGIEMVSIKSDPMKTAGASWEAITPEVKAFFQTKIYNIKSAFKADILSKRDVPDDAMTGLWYSGNEAVENNLIDGTLNNINDLISSFSE